MPVTATPLCKHAKFTGDSWKFALTIGEFSIENVRHNLGKEIAEILAEIPHIFATSNTAAIPRLLQGEVSGCTGNQKCSEISCSIKNADVTPDILAKVDAAFAKFAHLDVSKAIAVAY